MALRLGSNYKAYPVSLLREFAGWAVYARRNYADDHVLYLQADYSVTDGVYENQNVVFNMRSEEWLSFCRRRLKFPALAA